MIAEMTISVLLIKGSFEKTNFHEKITYVQ